jgi:aspartyl-tRNA(Asn)/glutamyl-tRNA(Gln) amidotransferase subunit A
MVTLLLKEFCNMSFLGISLAELLKSNAKAEEVTEFYKGRIHSHNEKLNVFLDVADESETLEGALQSMPIALKANISTQKLTTNASSKVLDGYIAPFNSTVAQKLATAGGSALGKTNMDAWAHGSSTETSDYGTTKNPYNIDYVPGGSSGGSAVAVAAGLAPAAIGTETAGSIRLPAAWSGVVGLKPTYGRVSRFGIVAMGSSWDCPGPMTQTVEDAALLLKYIAGHDPRDATTHTEDVPDYHANLAMPKPLTIGIPDEYLENADSEIVKSVHECIKILQAKGHTIKNIKLMSPSYSVSVYMLLQRSEVSSNLSRYDGIRYGNDRTFFGDEAKKRIMLGTYALSEGYADQYYKKAQKVRYMIRQNFIDTFREVDVIFAPTTPTTASKIGDRDTFAFYGEMMDILTEPAAAAGIPAISIPSKLHSNGLPIGVQFMGKHLDEQTILNVAHQLEHELAFDRLAIMKKYV